MLGILKKYFKRERKGEVMADEYFSSLLGPIDAKNIGYLRDSIHTTLLEGGVNSALIAVGSVVRGVSTKKQFYNSAGPNDIDLKVIIADRKQSKTFYDVLEKWGKNLDGKFVKVDGHPNEVRFTHKPFPEEHIDFHYDGGFRIEPIRGKTIDLIVKNTGYLLAGQHIEAERERNNTFVVLYHDK